jgi:hypothetical protein
MNAFTKGYAMLGDIPLPVNTVHYSRAWCRSLAVALGHPGYITLEEITEAVRAGR